MTTGSPAASVGDALTARSPDATASEATAAAPGPTIESWGEKLYAALPLFIVGGACLVIAVDLYYSGIAGQFGANGTIHLELWALFLALAVTGLAAGVFAMLMEDETETAAPAATPIGEAPPPAPIWDESTVKSGEEPNLLGPRPWERFPDLSEGPIAEAMPASDVLTQLDELEASLRKRPRPPAPE